MAVSASNALTEGAAIHPFRIELPQEEIDRLRRRVQATRWPEKETVADQSQGVQLAAIQELARYWGTDYGFRRVEARPDALPPFMTEIDGLDIHFIRVTSLMRTWCRSSSPVAGRARSSSCSPSPTRSPIRRHRRSGG
jgi:hypothetical protein